VPVLTQRAVAEDVAAITEDGCDALAVSRYERGAINPTASRLEALIRVLELDAAHAKFLWQNAEAEKAKPGAKLGRVRAEATRSTEPWFGEALEILMDEVGVSTDELARRISTDPKTIRNWRHGKNLPNVERAVEVAHALGVTPARLVTPPVGHPAAVPVPAVPAGVQSAPPAIPGPPHPSAPRTERRQRARR
jgi:transcriptional regulator with XRE-family HTH domain